MNTPKNIEELGDLQMRVIMDTLTKKLDPTVAGKTNAGIRNRISMVKAQLEYHHRRREKPDIPFMNTGRKAELIAFPKRKAA